MTSIKKHGRVYTPQFVVENILELSGYKGKKILQKHIIDNSCGDGAFLTIIVDYYCKEYLKINNDICKLKSELESYIHGIEIDENEHASCINNLDSIAAKYNLTDVKWDILNNDTLEVDEYDGLMDFVIGNPPYVRVHNLGSRLEEIKKLDFSKNGMTDLYIVFYEIGLKMLNDKGVLSYITPSSVFNSKAAGYFRDYIIEKNYLTDIVDFEHYQVFNVTTYSAILVLNKSNTSQKINYYKFDETVKKNMLIDKLNYSEIVINGNFYLAKKENLRLLTEINEFKGKEYVAVKNGFATLADSVFIGDSKTQFEREILIPVIKASTGIWTQCIYPYNRNKLISEEVLKTYPKVYNYLLNNKERLAGRSLDKNSSWYSFGRSQGINDVSKDKLAINSLIRDLTDLKVNEVKSGCGVYSGLYIISEIGSIEIRELLINERFVEYIKLLSKYKSGGYYTFSSKDVKLYLNYMLGKKYGGSLL